MSLSADVKSYIENRLPQFLMQEKFYREFNGELPELISKAVIGENEYDKIHPHQRRVGQSKANQGASLLLDCQNRISNCMSFEDVFVITEDIRKAVCRLGDLWSYDTALRIAFYLGFEPKEVYVQAGVEKGVEKILGRIRKARSIPITEFPIAIQQLRPCEVENFLCIWGGSSKQVC